MFQSPLIQSLYWVKCWLACHWELYLWVFDWLVDWYLIKYVCFVHSSLSNHISPMAQHRGSKLSKEVGQDREQNNDRAGGRTSVYSRSSGERRRERLSFEWRIRQKVKLEGERELKDEFVNLFSPCCYFFLSALSPRGCTYPFYRFTKRAFIQYIPACPGQKNHSVGCLVKHLNWPIFTFSWQVTVCCVSEYLPRSQSHSPVALSGHSHTQAGRSVLGGQPHTHIFAVSRGCDFASRTSPKLNYSLLRSRRMEVNWGESSPILILRMRDSALIFQQSLTGQGGLMDVKSINLKLETATGAVVSFNQDINLYITLCKMNLICYISTSSLVY